MFTLSQEKLVSLGASITTAEIKQQPDLWAETFALYTKKRVEIEEFLQKLLRTQPGSSYFYRRRNVCLCW